MEQLTKQDNFFEKIRHITVAFALIVLVPFLSYYTTEMLVPEKKSYQAWISEKQELEDRIRVVEQSKADLLNNPETATAIDGKLAEIDSELDGLSNQLSISKIRHEEEQAHKGLILFWVAGIIGLISIIFGLLSHLGFIGAGAILGGSVSLILGYSSYWSQLPIPLKLLSIVVALISIIGLSYYFSKK